MKILKKLSRPQINTLTSTPTFTRRSLIAFSLLGLSIYPTQAAKVFVGGGDNAAGAFNGYLANPAAWTFVRANADGYYINNFAMTGADLNTKLAQMNTLFTSNAVFYETDFGRATAAQDKVNIDVLKSQGWTVPYATCNTGGTNGGLTADRVTALNWRANRTVLALIAPWEIGGNIGTPHTDSNGVTNGMKQKYINLSDGSLTTDDTSGGTATDGPMGVWRGQHSSMAPGSFSLVRFSRNHNQTSMCMISPYLSGSGLKTDAEFFRLGQQCVREHENAGAAPDIWAIEYYAAQIQTHAVTPEQINGAPAATVTGMAYWLIKHLRGQLASIDFQPSPVLVTALDQKVGETVSHHATLGFASDEETSTLNYDIVNNDEHIEYTPVLNAKINNPNNQYIFHLSVGGKDCTQELTADGGLVFVNDLRLMPKEKQTLALKIERNPQHTGTDGNAGLPSVKFSLFAHPTSMDRLVQTSEVTIKSTAPTALASLGK